MPVEADRAGVFVAAGVVGTGCESTSVESSFSAAAFFFAADSASSASTREKASDVGVFSCIGSDASRAELVCVGAEAMRCADGCVATVFGAASCFISAAKVNPSPLRGAEE